jgi:hypothetical protein
MTAQRIKEIGLDVLREFKMSIENRENVVKKTLEWVNTPFHWGMGEKGVGCDCAGLVIGVGKECGYLPEDFCVPPYGRGVSEETIVGHLRETLLMMECQIPGAIGLVKPRGSDTRHLVIFISPAEMIHACEKSGKVICQQIPDGLDAVGFYQFKEII